MARYEDFDMPDREPFDSPPGWRGGRVSERGPGMYSREWHHPEKQLEAVYDHEEGVAEVLRMPDGYAGGREVVDRERPPAGDERAHQEAIARLMEKHSDKGGMDLGLGDNGNGGFVFGDSFGF